MTGSSNLYEWLVCPECGYDDFGAYSIPSRMANKNTYLTCPECGEEGVVVG